MDSHVRELFRVRVPRENADCAGTETPRAEAPVGRGSFPPIQLISKEGRGDAPSPSSQAQGLATADSSHAMSAPTPVEASTIQAESPFSVHLRPPSAWPIRPTSELPLAVEAGGVPHSQPSGVLCEEDMYRTGCSSWSATKSPSPRDTAIPTRGGAHGTHSGPESAVPRVSSSRNVAQDSTRVCSLCGVTVLLVGTPCEQQDMWRSHVNSWVHQRTLRVYAAAQNGRPMVSGYGINVDASLTPSPSLLRLLEVTTSPVAFPGEEEEEDPPITKVSEGVHQQQQQQKQHQQRHTANMRGEGAEESLQRQKPTINSETSKELDFGGGQLSLSPLSEELPVNLDGVLAKSKTTTPSVAAAGLYGKKPMKGSPLPRPNYNEKFVTYMLSPGDSTGRNPTGQPNPFIHEEPNQKKQREIERVLERYLAQKERQQLLFCLRRWFNAMFVRVTNMMNVSSIHANRSKQQEEVSSASPAPLTSTQREKRVRDAGTVTISPGITTQPAPVSESTEKPHAGLFIKSCTKDYAHVRPSSMSSSSFEMEVAETDVSWYVRPSQGCAPKEEGRRGVAEGKVEVKRKQPEAEEEEEENEGDEGAMQSSTVAGTLNSERSSVEEIIAALGPNLHNRVRAAMRGEVLRSSAFPKTSEVLKTLRVSSLVSTTGSMERTSWSSPSSSSRRSRVARSVSPRESPAPISAPDAAPLPSRAPSSGNVPLRTAAAESLLDAGVAAWSSAEAHSYPRHADSSSERCSGARHKKVLRPTPQRPHRSPLLSRASRGRGDAMATAGGVPSANGAQRRRVLSRFTGIPGEFYRYHAGAFHRVPDPKSDALEEPAGKRLPLYVVRRTRTPAPSPRGTLTATPTPTRARSPLGPARLNPYCSTCVARFNLIVVDEYMRPLATGQSRRSSANCVDCGGAKDRRAPSPSPSPEPMAQESSPAPCVVNAAAVAEKEREDEEWLLRKEKKLRKRMKKLLRYELPVHRDGKEWEEYLRALSEALRMLEALRARRAAMQS